MTTDSSGNVSARHDYLPYGEEIGGYGGRANHTQYQADSVRQKYTGFQRDDENGLDYAQARYYASKAGRFTSVDPLMASASVTVPQTLNRYTYALNNPYKYTDPTGMAVDGTDDELEIVSNQDPQRPPTNPRGSFDVGGCPSATPCDPIIAEFFINAPSAEPIATTDVQIVTELQIRTGVADPFAQGYTATLLDAMFSGNGGAMAGSIAVGAILRLTRTWAIDLAEPTDREVRTLNLGLPWPQALSHANPSFSPSAGRQIFGVDACDAPALACASHGAKTAS